jgi:hypothetical protein
MSSSPFAWPDAAALAHAERQQAYMEKAAQRQRMERETRLRRIEGEAKGIAAALRAYKTMDDGDVPDIRLRSGLMRLDRPRPPRDDGDDPRP